MIDDEPALLAAAEKILRKEGYRVAGYLTAQEGLDAIATSRPHLLITDLRLPDLDGLEVLHRAKAHRSDIEVIVMTGHGTIEKAVEAMRQGAYDFIQKPIDRVALLKDVHKALERQRLLVENVNLRRQLQQERGEEALVGNSSPMRALKTLIRQIAASDVSVLLQGESGTGKEVVAEVIHALSPRHAKPLVKISCAAIPDTLLESELFGYERGAFTGATGAKPGKLEQAEGGTLFLDEIAEVPLALQAKLLRVLQDRIFQRLGSTRDIRMDARLVCATHVDLRAAVEAKTFRSDLYYRIQVVPMVLPPLRDRHEDIPLLAHHLLKKHAARMQMPLPILTPEALEQLSAHLWPGNVRELENVIQHGLAVAQAGQITAFPLVPRPIAQTHGVVSIPLGTPLADAEKAIVDATLAHCDGSKEAAAKLLKVSARTLYRQFPKRRSRTPTSGSAGQSPASSPP